MNIPTEHNTIQAPLIRYAEQVVRTYILRTDAVALRKAEGGLLFKRFCDAMPINLCQEME